MQQHYITGYLRHVAHDRRLAASTVEAYRGELTLLLSRGIQLEAEALAAHVTRRADGSLLAATTRNRRLAILRGFCRYLVDRGDLPANPMDAIRRARVPRVARAAIGIAEMTRLLAVLAEQPGDALKVRDRAMLLLFFYAGLRVSEVVNLDVVQVDIAGACLRGANRKGGGTTDVVLHPAGLAALVAWLETRGVREESLAVFPGGNTGRLSVRMVQKRLAELGRRADLAIPLHPHALRHAHATALLSAGVNVEFIRMSMNHSSLNTTALYLHADLGALRAAIARLPFLGPELGPVSPVK